MKKLILIVGILLSVTVSQAAQKTVYVGTSGDKKSLNTNFSNIQDNFNEVYGYGNSKADKAAALVGDCTVGPCLDGTSDGGSYIKLWAGSGSYWTALQGGAPTANRSWRLPIAAPPVAGATQLMVMDESGAMGFLPIAGTTGYVLSQTTSGVYSWIANGSGGTMTYPGAGIAVSTGSAWGTSYTLGTLADALTHTFTGTTYSGTSLVTATQTILDTLDATVDLSAGTGITISSGQISVTAGTYQAYDSGMITWPSAVSATEVGYMDGVTSSVQSQLNSKAPLTAVSVDGSVSVSLTAAQVSGTIVDNYGQGASDIALVLPTAAAGYNALFVVGTAQAYKWGVRAGTTDKIYLLASDGTISAGSDNGYARLTNAQVGQSFACWTFKTGASTWDWQCKAGSVGTSTFSAN